MATRGVVDLVFCLDVSESMRPCIDGVRRHVGAFLEGLDTNGQWRLDWRLDFLAHACDSSGGPFRLSNIRRSGMDLVRSIYGGGADGDLFTTDLDPFRAALDGLSVEGDEATLIALDLAPRLPLAAPHGVPPGRRLPDRRAAGDRGAGQGADGQGSRTDREDPGPGGDALPGRAESPAFEQLSEADRSEYQVVDEVGDGLRRVDFGKMLARIGRSVSVANQQLGADPPVRRALLRPGPLGGQHGPDPGEMTRWRGC